MNSTTTIPTELRLIINNGPVEPVVIDLRETPELLNFQVECAEMRDRARQLAADAKAAELQFYRLVRTYAEETGYGGDHPMRDEFFNSMMELCDWNEFANELGI